MIFMHRVENVYLILILICEYFSDNTELICQLNDQSSKLTDLFSTIFLIIRFQNFLLLSKTRSFL